jgi:hypothetical protein
MNVTPVVSNSMALAIVGFPYVMVGGSGVLGNKGTLATDAESQPTSPAAKQITVAVTQHPAGPGARII